MSLTCSAPRFFWHNSATLGVARCNILVLRSFWEYICACAFALVSSSYHKATPSIRSFLFDLLSLMRRGFKYAPEFSLLPLNNNVDRYHFSSVCSKDTAVLISYVGGLSYMKQAKRQADRRIDCCDQNYKVKLDHTYMGCGLCCNQFVCMWFI